MSYKVHFFNREPVIATSIADYAISGCNNLKLVRIIGTYTTQDSTFTVDESGKYVYTEAGNNEVPVDIIVPASQIFEIEEIS